MSSGTQTHAVPWEEWTFEELQAEADDIRKRLNRLRTSVGRFFVKKQELVDLMMIAAMQPEALDLLAGELL